MGVHVALGLAVALGAFVQGSIGFGIAVVAAPFIVVWAPELMPVSMLVASLAVPVVQLVHGPREIAWRPLTWAIIGRVLFTPVGVWVVTAFSVDVIAALVGVLLLLTVAVSLTRVRIQANPGSAFAIGGVAGISAQRRRSAARSSPRALARDARAHALHALVVLRHGLGDLPRWSRARREGRRGVGAGRPPLDPVRPSSATQRPGQPARLLSSGRLRIAVLAFCAMDRVFVIIRALAS